MLRRLGGSLGRVSSPRHRDRGTGIGGPGAGEAAPFRALAKPERGQKGGGGSRARNLWPVGDFASPFLPGGRARPLPLHSLAGPQPVFTASKTRAVCAGGGGWHRRLGCCEAPGGGRWERDLGECAVCGGAAASHLGTSDCTSPRYPSRSPAFLSSSLLPPGLRALSPPSPSVRLSSPASLLASLRQLLLLPCPPPLDPLDFSKGSARNPWPGPRVPPPLTFIPAPTHRLPPPTPEGPISQQVYLLRNLKNPLLQLDLCVMDGERRVESWAPILLRV